MTHKEITKDDRQGYQSECPGELKSLGTYPDDQFDPVLRQIVRRQVTIWGCECGDDISAAAEGTILNVYRRPSHRRPGLFDADQPPDRPGASTDPDTGRGPR